MSEHIATVRWRRNDSGFRYEEYSRDHDWVLGEDVGVPASAAPEFLGSGRRADPEQALVAAISSCHMLTFLALCARKRIVVDSYDDRAVGRLDKGDEGRMSVTRVVLSPRIDFAGEPPDDEVLEKLHERSHHECFIANSVRTEISLNRLR